VEQQVISLSRLTWLVAVVLLSACSSSNAPHADADGQAVATNGGEIETPTDPGPGVGATPDPLAVPRLDIRETSQLYPYRSDSPYANVLNECAVVEDHNLACTLNSLPFIAQATPDFTRDDILNRLLVTHAWMGDRFAALLNDAPDIMIPLFGSVTSISIGSTVRPSNYWIGTGAIQLDPEGLWLSVLEKANVSTEEDYRSGFGDELQFWFFESMRSGRDAAVRYYSLTDRQERPYEDIKIPMYRLLYHELAHAVDYLPSQSVATLDPSLTPLFALLANENLFLSPRLNNDLPLYSQTLNDLGQVRYRGEAATELQKSFNPGFVGTEMVNDGAARFYSYSTEREDFATLFTQVMMKFSFDIDVYIAFVNKPVDEDDYVCSELLVGWGQKNRLADSLLVPRARWVVDTIYGSEGDFDSFFATEIGQTASMVSGVDWCTNRDGPVIADFPGLSKTLTADTSEKKKSQMQQLFFERRVRVH
jgi:hypothetical protein